MCDSRQAAAVLLERANAEAIKVAIVLGSGWGAAATDLGPLRARVDFADLPGFRPATVPGHAGHVDIIDTPGGPTALFHGRTHFYETRDAQAVAHPIRTLAAAGAARLILTNGCGSIRRDWPPGTVVTIADHINLTGASPLVGATFIDMSQAYSPRLRSLMTALIPTMPSGVYAQFPGPAYETPAEVRLAAVLGADLVGMSTALETLAAREAGLEVLGLSLVCNLAAGVQDVPLNHDEVLAAGRAAVPHLNHILHKLITHL